MTKQKLLFKQAPTVKPHKTFLAHSDAPEVVGPDDVLFSFMLKRDSKAKALLALSRKAVDNL
jgi:hypothetical protein